MAFFETTEILIAALVFMVSVFFLKFYVKKKNLPPGPMGLPIVGYMPYLGKAQHLELHELASKYGEVFSLYLGSRLVLVLDGVDAVKEGMNKPEFLGRPPDGAFQLVPDIPNILAISGKPFHEQRKFMLTSLKDLGLGKTVLEECMKDEIQYFLHFLDEWKDQPINVSNILTPSMSNNINALVYGTRYDYEDSRRKLLDNNREILIEFFRQTVIHVFLPWIIKVPFVNTILGYHRAEKASQALLKFNKDQIEQHRKTLDANNTRDYIDKFLLEMEEAKKKNVTDTSFTEGMLMGNIGALMGAGSETVQTTVNWCLYIMAVYPDVQRKVQQEIDSIIGSERMPSYADQKRMPYSQAVIMETMRWKTITPLNILRYTFGDTTFRGYDIPKDTIILANLWSAHNDPKYWDRPEDFNPERFLRPGGKDIVKQEGYMPFSVGRRSCPGESMANVEVFIYFTSILQKFFIRLPEGDVPDFEGILTVTYQLKPHKLCFMQRSSA